MPPTTVATGDPGATTTCAPRREQPRAKKGSDSAMADVIELQHEEPEVPDEPKTSNVSYFACNNSNYSQTLCWRF